MTCLVPCGLGTPGRALFDVDKLVAARDHGRTDTQCNVSDCTQYPTIDSLLGATPGAVSLTATRPTDLGAIRRDLTELVFAQVERMGHAQHDAASRMLAGIDSLSEGQLAILAQGR